MDLETKYTYSTVQLFLDFGGSFWGCPSIVSPTIWGLYEGPLICANFLYLDLSLGQASENLRSLSAWLHDMYLKPKSM